MRGIQWGSSTRVFYQWSFFLNLLDYFWGQLERLQIVQKSNLVRTQHFKRNTLNCIEAFKLQFCYISSSTFCCISKCCVPTWNSENGSQIPINFRTVIADFLHWKLTSSFRFIFIFVDGGCKSDGGAQTLHFEFDFSNFSYVLFISFWLFHYTGILEFLSSNQQMLLTWWMNCEIKKNHVNEWFWSVRFWRKNKN